MKNPVGRRVITATWTPGFPIVVRFLVRSSVRPAAAPESTWIAESRDGLVGSCACGGGATGVGEGTGGGLAGDTSGRILVWVSERFAPPAWIGWIGGGGVGICGATTAAGAATTGFLMIMVFSKSPAEAAMGASLKYLSLCLPISITSLFCRKCFLIGLPLTRVPLVELRSSMNESLRIVMMAACSPETAKLSTGISLCGFRPSVVRSLLSVISFSTVPSTLKISFAMALTLKKFFQLHFCRRECSHCGALSTLFTFRRPTSHST